MEEYRRRARELPPSLGGPGLTDALRDLERSVLGRLETGAQAGYAPGAGKALARALSAWRDEALRAIFRRAGIGRAIAVVAVGGYGRSELAPGSDLDLLVVPQGRLGEAEAAALEKFLHQLWDLGYAVASSTRRYREIAADVRDDPQLMTSLLTSRHVAGDPAPFEAMRVVVAKALDRGRRAFLDTRRLDLEGVIASAGSEVLVKEPNLKTSPGGLRSIQIAQWVDLALPGRSGNTARLERARDFFLYLRCLLHFMTGRKEDVLRMEHQHAVARVLRISGGAEEMMVKLMRHYYNRATDVVVALLGTMDALRGSPPAVDEPVAPRRAFERAQETARTGGEPTGELIRYLSAASTLVDSETARDRELFVRFRDLLLHPRSYRGLQVLKLSGLLHAYLRPLRPVRHRIVHNPFHRHTVDQHSLEAVRELESFADRARGDPDRYGLPAELTARYADTLWVVKLTLLVHDVGKAYEGDHAKNGAEMVAAYLRDLPTESLIKEMIVFLAENHLLLSAIARRGFQGDRGAVENFASEIIRSPYPEEALDFLYLLTCADASATNERVYTSYQAAALAGLYRETAEHLENERSAQQAGAAGAEEPHLADLERRGLPADAMAFARELGPLYTRITPPEGVLRDLELALTGSEAGYDLGVSVFNDHLTVKILAADRPGLFSLLAGILLVNGADIVRATIHTWRTTAIDLFVVTDVHGNEILEKQMEKELEVWVQDVRASFDRFWRDPDELDRVITGIERRTRPVHAAFLRETGVSAQRTGPQTLHLDLTCTDRPALLYDVTRRISSLGLDISSATIDTTGWYVHDSFEVRSATPLEETRIAALRRELSHAARPRT